MRVLYLSHTAQPSGAELALYGTVSAMVEESPVVLFGQEGPMKGRFEAAGIPTVLFELPPQLAHFNRLDVRLGRGLLRPARQGIGYLRCLEGVVRDLRPDVIVSNSSKSHVIGFCLSPRLGVPLVSIVRDRLTTDFYSPFGARLLRTGLAAIPAGVISNSVATAATLSPSWSRHQVRAVVPSPVAAPRPELLLSRVRDRRGRPLRVGIAGRLAPWKGQHVVIEAFERAFSPGQAELHLLGGALFGESDYEASLRRLATSLGVDSFVFFHGHVEDVYAEMATWDVFVHASVIPEPFGQVVVQAMHMSLPTLATAAGGPLETIADGVNGVLYPPGDVEALAALLRRLSEDEGLRDRLGTAASVAARRFLPEELAPHVRAVLRAVVGRDRAGGLRPPR
jgi:glycosyltransferase involved in cell wall biosynthesis